MTRHLKLPTKDPFAVPASIGASAATISVAASGLRPCCMPWSSGGPRATPRLASSPSALPARCRSGRCNHFVVATGVPQIDTDLLLERSEWLRGGQPGEICKGTRE